MCGNGLDHDVTIPPNHPKQWQTSTTIRKRKGAKNEKRTLKNVVLRGILENVVSGPEYKYPNSPFSSPNSSPLSSPLSSPSCLFQSLWSPLILLHSQKS